MLAIIENKWEINYIKALHAEIQKKLLREILKKFFITKKCTQCKTSNTLKTDVFDIPDHKNVEKLFLKY